MEHINTINRERYQVAMMVGMYLALALLLAAIMVIVQNVKEIKSDPISYGIEKKDFRICTCYDKKGNSYDYNSTGVMPKKAYGWNIDLTLKEE